MAKVKSLLQKITTEMYLLFMQKAFTEVERTQNCVTLIS